MVIRILSFFMVFSWILLIISMILAIIFNINDGIDLRYIILGILLFIFTLPIPYVAYEQIKNSFEGEGENGGI